MIVKINKMVKVIVPITILIINSEFDMIINKESVIDY